MSTHHRGQSFQRYMDRKKPRTSTDASPTKAPPTAEVSMADDSVVLVSNEENNIETLTRLETQHKEEVLGLKNALKRRESELVRIDDLLTRLEERRGTLQETLQELQPSTSRQNGRESTSRRDEEITDLEEQLNECRSAREECLEELAALKNALDRRGHDLSDIIAQKDKQIHELLGRLEESHCAREESLMELHVLKTSVYQQDNLNLELSRKDQEIQNLQAKLKESQRDRDDMAGELRALKNKSAHKDGEFTSRDKEVQDLSAKLEANTRALEEKNEEVRQMRKKYGAVIQKLESKMEDMADLNSRLYDEVERARQFELEVERSKREKSRLSQQLVVVEKEVVEKSEKISELDELVKRLEDSLKNMNGERTSLLTTMTSVIEKSAEMGSVTLLQQQLAATQNQLVMVQEQYTQAKDKVTILEKKIEDSDKTMTELKIDLRIATRNLNRYEKKEQDEKSDSEKYQTETAKLKEQCGIAENKIKDLENQHVQLETTLKEKEAEIEKSKILVAEHQDTLEMANQELNEKKQELIKVTATVDQYATLNEKNEEIQKALKENQQKLVEKDRKIKQLQNNIDLLKETCLVLETQLKDFESAITAANTKVDTLAAEKTEIGKSLATTKEALRTANLQINEQKSMRIFNEKQIEQLKARLNSEELDAHSQVTEVNEQLAKSSHTIQTYELELNEVQAKCDKLEEEVTSWKNQVEHYKSLMTTSKSESSTFLMQIVKLKEANIALQNGFEESISKCEQLKTNINELNDKVSNLTAEKMDANLRFESVVQQQNKLIDHLQQQLEQVKSKKSRGFVERIFGHGEKSENATPAPRTPATPFGKSRTLETPLKRPEFTLASPAPAKVLSEIQNVTKVDVVEDTRKPEECILLKEDLEVEVAPAVCTTGSTSAALLKTLLFHENKQLDIHCCHFIQKDLYLIGCMDGLYSLNVKSGRKTKIDGIDAVWAISFEPSKDYAVAIEGPQRNLVRINLGLLRACAEAAECSKPKVTSTPIMKIANAYVFKTMDSYIAVAGEKYLKILSSNQDGFFIKFNLQCPTNVTSLLLTTQQTLLFGTDLVYELDLMNGQVEEFMDTTDSSLQVNITNCSQFKQYPLAILDLTPNHVARKNPVQREYLVAFPDFGIFLDETGRRAREQDIVWSKLPSCIEYHEPNLYIEHFTCIEVLQLNSKSFTKTNEPSVFLQLKTPKLLGCGDSSGSMFVVTTSKNLTNVYKVNYPRTLHPFNDPPSSEANTSVSSDEKYRVNDDTTSMGSTNTLSSF